MRMIQAYRARLDTGELEANPAQALAVEKLQILAGRLHDYSPTYPKKISLALFGWRRERIVEQQLQGMYIYGEAGRGKSMLMDLFFETAPISPKRRVHFHAFMQEVHAGIKGARLRGAEDPVEYVADAVADSATLLCVDEIQITDITDAMLVGRLFQKLFKRAVVIVATSNRHPDALYEGGWNRDIFLPFIHSIKERMEIHELSSSMDHRRNRALASSTYHMPADATARCAIDVLWLRMTRGKKEQPLTIKAHGRQLRFAHAVGRILRTDFETLCARPLGPADYLALTHAIDCLFLENVPVLSARRENEAKRFVTLIDAVYESRVKLVISADKEPDALYVEGEGAFEFGRTASRLEEMRRSNWWR